MKTARTSTKPAGENLRTLQAENRRKPIAQRVREEQPVRIVPVPQGPDMAQIARAQQAQRSAGILGGRVRTRT